MSDLTLIVISDYGANETVVENADEATVTSTMNGLDWDGFHQVILRKLDGDFMEVGGSAREDGLSGLVQVNGEEFVTSEPPDNVEQLLGLLLSYLRGDGRWESQAKWDGFTPTRQPPSGE